MLTSNIISIRPTSSEMPISDEQISLTFKMSLFWIIPKNRRISSQPIGSSKSCLYNMKIIRTRNNYARNRLSRVKTELPPLYSKFWQALSVTTSPDRGAKISSVTTSPDPETKIWTNGGNYRYFTFICIYSSSEMKVFWNFGLFWINWWCFE